MSHIFYFLYICRQSHTKSKLNCLNCRSRCLHTIFEEFQAVKSVFEASYKNLIPLFSCYFGNTESILGATRLKGQKEILVLNSCVAFRISEQIKESTVKLLKFRLDELESFKRYAILQLPRLVNNSEGYKRTLYLFLSHFCLNEQTKA